MPLVPFIGFFLSVGKDTGPHDPLLPRGPTSCQSAPVGGSLTLGPWVVPECSNGQSPPGGPHEMPLVPFIGFFGLGKDTGAP
ncbi:unnamed protein product [Staurois parvus]|uniref:Uncharacterized protein n=1 Tax=Staurois parvus TaxID=386267 RepID=A0ABN9EW85_9NEOB|nr:unnamed protein product [Staurois parvus]